MLRLSKKEFKKMRKESKVDTGSSSTVHTCNKTSSIDSEYDEAVQTLRDIQSLFGPYPMRGPLGIEILDTITKKADDDNILKGIKDGLQGSLFEDDKQFVESRVLLRSRLRIEAVMSELNDK